MSFYSVYSSVTLYNDFVLVLVHVMVYVTNLAIWFIQTAKSSFDLFWIYICETFRSHQTMQEAADVWTFTLLLYINMFPKLVQGVISISNIKSQLEGREPRETERGKVGGKRKTFKDCFIMMCISSIRTFTAREEKRLQFFQQAIMASSCFIS